MVVVGAGQDPRRFGRYRTAGPSWVARPPQSQIRPRPERYMKDSLLATLSHCVLLLSNGQVRPCSVETLGCKGREGFAKQKHVPVVIRRLARLYADAKDEGGVSFAIAQVLSIAAVYGRSQQAAGVSRGPRSAR